MANMTYKSDGKNVKITVGIPDTLTVKRFDESSHTLMFENRGEVGQLVGPYKVKNISYKKKIIVIEGEEYE